MSSFLHHPTPNPTPTTNLHQVHESRSSGRGNPFKHSLASLNLILNDASVDAGLRGAIARLFVTICRVPGARTHGMVHGLTVSLGVDVMGVFIHAHAQAHAHFPPHPLARASTPAPST